MNPPAVARAHPSLLATVCLLVAGCRAMTGAAWLATVDTPEPRSSADDERASHTPRTLPVEVRFVRHDPRDPAFGVELWNHVDEQALAADLRRRLAANGLRAGVVTGSLPGAVAARLEPAAAIDPAAPEDVGLLQLLRILPGKRAEVVSAAGIPELTLLERDADGVRGATYRDATALVALQAWPDADGWVRLRIVPEVKHGAVQRSWIGEEGMFRLETGQARHTFDELGFTTRIPAGGVVLVAATDVDGAAVGDALLRDRSAAGGTRLLMIRPLTAAADRMFAATDSDGGTGDR